MDLSEPATALGPGLALPVLRALASRATGATAEQVRRVAGVGTHAGVRRALDRLAYHGLISQVSVGSRTTLYSLNRDHLLYPALQCLMAAIDALPERIAHAVSTWALPPVCAALFGSAARRDGGVNSDIDLLVVRPAQVLEHNEREWDEQLHELRDQVLSWTGNQLQVLDRTTVQLAALVEANEPIVTDWRRDSVAVYGVDIRELIGEPG